MLLQGLLTQRPCPSSGQVGSWLWLNNPLPPRAPEAVGSRHRVVSPGSCSPRKASGFSRGDAWYLTRREEGMLSPSLFAPPKYVLMSAIRLEFYVAVLFPSRGRQSPVWPEDIPGDIPGDSAALRNHSGEGASRTSPPALRSQLFRDARRPIPHFHQSPH